VLRENRWQLRKYEDVIPCDYDDLKMIQKPIVSEDESIKDNFLSRVYPLRQPSALARWDAREAVGGVAGQDRLHL
jgi:hypothetical protein